MEKLIKDSPKSDGAKELLSGIYDLRNGTITSLMLSTEKNADRVMAAVTDEIRIGELTINAKSRKVARLGEEISLTPRSSTSYISWQKTGDRYLRKNRFIRPCGRKIICWTTAISWPLSESCERKSSPIRTNRNTS